MSDNKILKKKDKEYDKYFIKISKYWRELSMVARRKVKIDKNISTDKKSRIGKKVNSFSLGKTKIGIKLSLSIALIIICSVSLIIILSLSMISKTIMKQAEKDTYGMLQKTGKGLASHLSEIDRFGMFVSRDENISSLIGEINLSKDDESRDRLISRIEAQLNTLYGSRNDLMDIIATDTKGYGSIAGAGSFIDISKPYTETIGFKEFRESKKSSMWLDTHITDIVYGRKANEKRVISLFKSIYTATSLNKSVGVLQLCVKESALNDVINDTQLPYEGRFLVLGELGNVILNPDNSDENGLLISEINKIDKNGQTVADFTGKKDLTYKDKILDKPLFKLGEIKEVDEEFRNGLSERDGYITEQIYEAVMNRTNKLIESDTENNQDVEFGEVVGNDFRVNGKRMLVAYYHIESIDGTPLNWTIISMTPVSKITENIKVASRQIVHIGVICLLVGIIISTLMAKDISSGINVLTELMNKIKKGELEVECDIKRKDEIGNLALSFGDMVNNLKNMIAGIKGASCVAIDSSKSVACSCQESYSSIQQFSAMLSEVKNVVDTQMSEIEVSANVANQLSDQIQIVTKDFENVSKIVAGARELSEESKKSVNKLLTNASEVKDTVAEFGKLAEMLKAESSEISKITGFIRGIANQTNLLALNAAIEAARAGEAGKSFSIVASEIRTLAEQSNDSVNFIENKLKNISDTVQMTGEFIKASDSVMGEHDCAVNDTIGKLDNIVEFMDSLFTQMREIEKSIHDIEVARINITEFVSKITQSTEKTKENVQVIAGSMDEQVELIKHLTALSDNLNVLSGDLENTINMFKV